MAAYQKGLGIREKPGFAEPGNADLQRELSVSYNKIGQVLASSGKSEEALGAYRQGQAILERLVATNPELVQVQRDLALDPSRSLGGALAILYLGVMNKSPRAKDFEAKPAPAGTGCGCAVGRWTPKNGS